MTNDIKSHEQLFMESFEKTEAVCSHIHRAALEGKKNTSAYPLCIQIYEDGYDLYWYCNECINSYGLSLDGTYVYDAEDDLKLTVENLPDFELNLNEDQNPFSEFLEHEAGYLIKKSELAEFNLDFDVEKPLENGKLKRIPFGSEWVHKAARSHRRRIYLDYR